ncbi:hypothetical protein R3P38DRAFT_3206216 [Favolaschia claudopus]|uniref:Uncharacterized protein n=1 Tax=Favolaschia claudopus TaxID=2862362 RepID=A0AAW0AKA7_9AGAR
MPVYGTDTREEVLAQAVPQEMRANLHKSIGAIITKGMLDDRGDAYVFNNTVQTLQDYLLKTKFPSAKTVDDKIKFLDQKICAFGTAFVVHDNILVTSAHSLFDNVDQALNIDGFVEGAVVVFGWEASSGNAVPSSFPKSQVYEIQDVLAIKTQRPDYCFLRTKSPIATSIPRLSFLQATSPGSTPTSTTPVKGGSIVTAGFPSGLAMKVVQGVIESYPPNITNSPFPFMASVLAGAAGSPIFSIQAGAVSPYVIGMVEAGRLGEDYQNVDGRVEEVQFDATASIDPSLLQRATRVEAMRWAIDSEAALRVTAQFEFMVDSARPTSVALSCLDLKQQEHQLGVFSFADQSSSSPSVSMIVAPDAVKSLGLLPIEIQDLVLKIPQVQTTATSQAQRVQLYAVTLQIMNPDVDNHPDEFTEKRWKVFDKPKTVTISPLQLTFPVELRRNGGISPADDI